MNKRYLTRWGWRTLRRWGITSTTYDLAAVELGWRRLAAAVVFATRSHFDVPAPGGEQ